MALSDAIADLQKHPPRNRGPACYAGTIIRKLRADDQAAIYATGDKIAARESTVTWVNLAQIITTETGTDLRGERLSRHCRRQCACWR